MAITSVSTLAGLRDRIRFVSGIQSTEIVDDDLDLVISISSEWFTEQTGLSYDVTSADAAYDNAIMYYSCYLASIAQNGMGIEQLRIGDIFIQYVDEEPYQKYLEMANAAIIAKQAMSIKTSTYNANSTTGDVDWKKNIDGSSSTLNVRNKPRGM
ncbi:hypothetical protein CMI47_17285 [Candidatus Pacearchaeota archaeon]|nr:hypothetical protein [Candidatus Pacearchaeota archaeon]|tara:strand:- start:422 stop:886 length:465 start_codon:yes stop_codon:yes gene_type:complete